MTNEQVAALGPAFTEYLRCFRPCFLTTSHSDADIEAYQTHLSRCESQPVVGQLRRLARDKSAPFQRVARRMTVGTPTRNQPSDGLAYTCFDGEFENRRIRLLVEGTDNQIEVHARGGYECLPGRAFPDLQINASAAARLFGKANPRA